MPPSESAQGRRERLLATKAALIQQIRVCQDRILAMNVAPKRPLLSWDSDSDTSVVITPPPALCEIHNQALQCLNNRLLATQELRGIQKLDIEVEVLKQRPELPTLAAEEDDTGAGVWREVTAEGCADIVPFEMHFYVYENKKGALHYRSLTTTVVKTQHKAELQTTLDECQKPGLAIECISRYSCGYTERGNTLLELSDMFGSSLECEKLVPGGFRLSCGKIVLIDWILECGVMKPCRHRFRFQVADECEIDDELYTIMKKAQQKLKEKDLSSQYRSRVLKTLIEICLGKFDLLPEVKSESDDDQMENIINSNDATKDTAETVGKRANVDGKEHGTENTRVPKRHVKELEDEERAINMHERSAKKLKDNNGKDKVKNLDVKTSAEIEKERVIKPQGVQKEKENSRNDHCRKKTLVNRDQKINSKKNESNKSNKGNEIAEAENMKTKSDVVAKSKDKPEVKDQDKHLIPYVLQDTEPVHQIRKKQLSVKHLRVNKKGIQNVEVNYKKSSRSPPNVHSEHNPKNNQSKETKERSEKSLVLKINEQTTKIGTKAAKTNFKNKEMNKKSYQGQPSLISNELLHENKNELNHNIPEDKEKKEIIEKKKKTKENKTHVVEHDKIKTNDNQNVTNKGNEHLQKDNQNKQNVKENRPPQSLESKNKNIDSQIIALSSKSQKKRGQLAHTTNENRKNTSTTVSRIQLKPNTITDIQERKTSYSVRPNVGSNIKASLSTKSKVLKTTVAKLKSPIAKSKSNTIKSKSTNVMQKSPTFKPISPIFKPKSHNFKPKSPIIKLKCSIINPKVLEARPNISSNGLKKKFDRPKSLAPMGKFRSHISLGSIEKNQKNFMDAKPKSILNFGNKDNQMNTFRSKIPIVRTSPRVTMSLGEKKTFWTSQQKKLN